MKPMPFMRVLHCRGQVLEQPIRRPVDEGRGVLAWLRYMTIDRLSRRRILLAIAAHNQIGELSELRHRLSRVKNLNARLILGGYPHDTLLGWAVSQHNLGLAQVALELGADPNVPSGQNAETPLCQAARTRNEPMARLLVDFGASWEGRGFSYGESLETTGLREWLSAAWHAQENGWTWAVAEAMKNVLETRWEAPSPTPSRPRL